MVNISISAVFIYGVDGSDKITVLDFAAYDNCFPCTTSTIYCKIISDV